jgi:hypothetical protein
MMPETIAILIAAGFGILGGLVRLLVVGLKAVQFRRISWQGLWVYAVVVLSVGAFSGILLNFGKVLSFLAGYAGLDLIEGYYKTFMKTKVKIRK